MCMILVQVVCVNLRKKLIALELHQWWFLCSIDVIYVDINISKNSTNDITFVL